MPSGGGTARYHSSHRRPSLAAAMRSSWCCVGQGLEPDAAVLEHGGLQGNHVKVNRGQSRARWSSRPTRRHPTGTRSLRAATTSRSSNATRAISSWSAS